MCDTLFKDIGNTNIFMKNSDRNANEPNLIIFAPEGKARKTLLCTYITIEDNKDRYASILYKPSWTWGAEMGINEHNVVIGNEAVFTKSGYNDKTQSLIGMDYVRLVLERAAVAIEGVKIIVELLEKYGQGGNCGFDHSFYYDNSFLIADLENAYIVETSGKNYRIRKTEQEANISNMLTVGKKHYSSKEYFSKNDIDKVISFSSGSKERLRQGEKSLKKIKTDNPREYFAALRTHIHGNYNKLFKKGSVKSVCMHAGILGDHSTGSMVSFISKDLTTIWLTGSSSPCLSVFKPVYFSHITAPVFIDEKESFDYWLKREKVNRCIYSRLIDYKEHQKKVYELESEFILKEKELIDQNAYIKEFHDFSDECSKKENEFIESYKSITDKMDIDVNILNKYWAKKSVMLGKNVFEKSLDSRIKK